MPRAKLTYEDKETTFEITQEMLTLYNDVNEEAAEVMDEFDSRVESKKIDYKDPLVRVIMAMEESDDLFVETEGEEVLHGFFYQKAEEIFNTSLDKDDTMIEFLVPKDMMGFDIIARITHIK